MRPAAISPRGALVTKLIPPLRSEQGKERAALTKGVYIDVNDRAKT